jgi:hypothetical protein
MSFGIYLIGYVIVIAGLVYGAATKRARIPDTYSAVRD